jgi:hypothetical protein
MAAHLLREAQAAGLGDALREHRGSPYCSLPPPPSQKLSTARQPQQQQMSQNWQQPAAAADACGGNGSSAAADVGSSSRQDSLLQQLEACFEHSSYFEDDDGVSFLQSDPETEEYAGSFTSSSELSSSVATACLGVTVLAGLTVPEGACCSSSSALPSPLLSPLSKPVKAACVPDLDTKQQQQQQQKQQQEQCCKPQEQQQQQCRSWHKQEQQQQQCKLQAATSPA